jgi:predicted pyridoxine 5'-phosphate oxidase superfamily flavin-nucleotide-binding protein
MQVKAEFTIADETALRRLFDDQTPLAAQKCLSALDAHATAFIRRAPFVCLGTQDMAGRADVSPRGDPAGFVQVLDPQTLAIPDRPCNNRLVTDPDLLAGMRVNDRLPKLAILVEVSEVFLHCAKAFRRSGLWDPSRFQDRKAFPSLSQMILEQAGRAPAESEVPHLDADLEVEYQRTMY